MRELQWALFKIQHRLEFKDPLKEPPPEADLPSENALISREFVEDFCAKQEWLVPDFWWAGLAIEPRRPGRPSVMSEIAEELRARDRRGRRKSVLIQEARDLASWAKLAFPGKHTPEPESIATRLGPVFNALKSRAPQ